MKPVTEDRVAAGATLPGSVELLATPGDWGPEVTQYRYVYSDHVVLVEPSSRRVIQIID